MNPSIPSGVYLSSGITEIRWLNSKRGLFEYNSQMDDTVVAQQMRVIYDRHSVVVYPTVLSSVYIDACL